MFTNRKAKFVDENLNELPTNIRYCDICGENKELSKFQVRIKRNPFGEKIRSYSPTCYSCMMINEKTKEKNGEPNRIFTAIKNNCKTRENVDFLLDKPSFIEWYNKEPKVCHYCKRTFEQINGNYGDKLNRKFSRLSIDRRDNNIGYLLSNIVLACCRCNFIKSSYFTEDEMLEIGKIIHHKELTRGILGNI